VTSQASPGGLTSSRGGVTCWRYARPANVPAPARAFSEALSDTGDLTGRGSPILRGAITGFGTFLGGVLHTLPFLIPQYRPAVLLALVAMAFELLTLAWIRRRFLGTGFLRSFISVTLGGAVIATIGAALGAVG
jgi:erythrin-vacuolar iron transport family protein